MEILEVAQFVRKPAEGAYSIERVDADVRAALPSWVLVQVIENCRLSHNVLPRLQDALRARRYVRTVNHVTGDVHYLTFFLPKKSTILTIHDTEMVDRSRGLKRFLLWFFWLWLPVRRCTAVVTISYESKRQLLGHVHCDPSKIIVIHNPISDIFRLQEYPAITGLFKLLHIGTQHNKNLERVIEAVAGLQVELIIVGKLKEHHFSLLRKHSVTFRNLVGLSDPELVSVYQNAHALSFVSTSEGFGLPIVEAQAVGRPVITSACAPMTEVAGDGALFVDPGDTAAIRAAYIRVMIDAELRERLIRAGVNNVSRFAAAKIAQMYADLYAKVAKLAR